MTHSSIRKRSEHFTFDAYRKSDVYSFALVIWEVLRKTDLPNHQAEEYALPFHLDVGPDPSFDEMSKVVCVDGRRPLVDPRWSEDKVRFPNSSSFTKIFSDFLATSSSASAARITLSYGPFVTIWILCFQITAGMSRLMVESWHQDPSARPSSLRLKKSMAILNPAESVFNPASQSSGSNPNFKPFSISGTMT